MRVKLGKFILAIIAISIFLGIGLIWLQIEKERIAGFGGTKREDLENVFLDSFPEKQYDSISEAEHGRYVVFLGKANGQGNYAIFEKSLFFDSWTRVDRQVMEYMNHPMMIDAPTWGRIYLSLNDRNIAKAFITKDDSKTEEILVDPNKPLVIITDYEIDKIIFVTENHQEISEKDFLDSPF